MHGASFLNRARNSRCLENMVPKSEFGSLWRIARPWTGTVWKIWYLNQSLVVCEELRDLGLNGVTVASFSSVLVYVVELLLIVRNNEIWHRGDLKCRYSRTASENQRLVVFINLWVSNLWIWRVDTLDCFDKINSCDFFLNVITCRGYAVAQLVEALRYKSEGRGFDSRWCHWNFSLT